MKRSLAIFGVAALASFASLTPVMAAHRSGAHVRFMREPLHHAHGRGGTLVGQRHNRGHRLAALVGDRESGLGFYPPVRPRLPYNISTPQQRAVRDAIDSQAVYSYYGDNGFGERHAHTVFNPVDGYGTPFFAGYYGPAGDPDEDRGPFGTPYRD